MSKRNRQRFTKAQKRAMANKDHPEEESRPIIYSDYDESFCEDYPRSSIKINDHSIIMRPSPLAPGRAKDTLCKTVDIRYLMDGNETLTDSVNNTDSMSYEQKVRDFML